MCTSNIMLNNTLCDNVSVDLSMSSVRLTEYKHLLVVIATLFVLVAAFVVGGHCLLISAVIHQRYHRSPAGTFHHITVSSHKLIMLVSTSFHHVILCGFCLPLTIFQMVSNGRWSLDRDMCTVRTYVESLVEIVNVYHMIYTCIDAYVMVCHPLKYRRLPAKFGYVMAFFSWSIPVTTTAFFLSLGWHVEGIEEIIYCLQVHNLCITLYSWKYLMFIIPISVLICVPSLIGISVLVLKEIQRINERRDHMKNRIKDAFKLANNKINIRDSHLELQIGKFHQNWQDPEENLEDKIHYDKESYLNEQSFRTCQTLSQIRSIDSDCNESNNCVKNGSTIKETAAKNKVSKLSRTWRACHKIGLVVIWHCLYWVSFVAFFVLLLNETKMFPLWTVSLVAWFRYFNSALNTALLYRHKTVRVLIKSLLGKT
uniref:G-protein coupled receptors family 1 profile domain-containing protein n=1 Tax=Biomphalaria glabrata TaxID=6526 RepID=A0A2C9LYH0_BIOGL